MITSGSAHQHLASGFPIGKRFRSAVVRRVDDGNDVHLGHLATADGRWRIYVFADASTEAATSFADWIAASPQSPIVRLTPGGADADARFDLKVIYQQPHGGIEMNEVPAAFTPLKSPWGLVDENNVFGIDADADIFEIRGIDRAGAAVVVRPDQYVAGVFPLAAIEELASFFDGISR
jgi:phenol 2-monooxygenase